MFEVCERATMFPAARGGLCLDLKDPKKMRTMEESQGGGLTSKDMGMLELTSPELERLILDPANDRFLGGRTFHQQQQQQPGHGAIARDEQDHPHRPFESSLDPPLHHPNLPEPALEAAFSSDEDSNTGHSTYINLNSASTETGLSFNVDSKPVYIQGMTSATAGGCSSSSRMGTRLPTAVHPGESYLPFGAFHSAHASRLKEEPMQMVPCLDGSPASSYLSPMSPINMDEQDRAKQERKRERNRMAARKCRTKKLEQIMLLEGRVNELKEQNRALGDTATALRAMMNSLQSQISQHISCGCPMMMMPATTTSPSSFVAQ